MYTYLVNSVLYKIYVRVIVKAEIPLDGSSMGCSISSVPGLKVCSATMSMLNRDDVEVNVLPVNLRATLVASIVCPFVVFVLE